MKVLHAPGGEDFVLRKPDAVYTAGRTCNVLQFKDKLLPSSARLTAIKGALFSWHPREIRIAQHMNIQLNHNGQQMGTFTREQVEGMIRGGAITYETLGWTEGQTVWRPVRDLIGASVPPPPPLVVSPASVSKELHPVAAYFVPFGRIRRGMWFLRNLAHGFGLGLIAALTDGSLIILPALCLWIYLTIVNAGKRLHDCNISAWFSFLVFLPPMPLVMLLWRSTKGLNKYGPEPDGFWS